MMEFHEKLQELRRQKGLTQEELAELLYVSRTAVSKWESGRGYPNIESLKAISKCFSVTIDDLLSGEEVLTIAEEDRRRKETQVRDLVFGLLDCAVAMFLFLPLFGQSADGMVRAVSLLALSEIPVWMRAAYLVFVVGMTAMGVLTLALQNCRAARWERNRRKLSLGLGGAGVLLFIVSRQPYAAILLFLFLAIKALLLMKWQ